MNKRLLSLVLTVTMILSMVPAFTVSVSAGETSETTGTVGTYTVLLPDGVTLPSGTGSDTTVTPVTNTDTTWGAIGQTTWYVVPSGGAIKIEKKTVNVEGDVHLILEDGCDITVTGMDGTPGVSLSMNAKLTVYSQSTNSNKGSLTIYGGSHQPNGREDGIKGLQGNLIVYGGNISIYGGNVGTSEYPIHCKTFKAYEGDIKVIPMNNGGTINADIIEINGGQIHSENGTISAEQSFIISDGQVKAQILCAVELNISDGIVNVQGIKLTGESPKLNITGGNISAMCIMTNPDSSTEGKDMPLNISISGENTVLNINNTYEGMPAIDASTPKGDVNVIVSGGAINVTGSAVGISVNAPQGDATISISGGTVNATATGTDGTGILVKSDSETANLEITGGEVTATATGTNGTGILVKSTSGTAILDISGNSAIVNSKGKANGIYAASNVNISGGMVNAFGDTYGIESRDITITCGNTTTNGYTQSLYGDNSVKVYKATETDNDLFVTDLDEGTNIYTATSTSGTNIQSSFSGTKLVRIAPAVCYIDENENGKFDGNENGYGSIQSAINSAGTKKPIVLIADDTEDVVIDAGDDITLDLNGHVLFDNGNNYRAVIEIKKGSGGNSAGILTIVDSNTDKLSHNFEVSSDGLWALTDKEYTKTYENLVNSPAQEGDVIKVIGGVITSDNGTRNRIGIEICENASLTLNSGSIIGFSNTGIFNDGYFVMNNGLIAGNIAVDSYGAGVQNNKSFVMKGGKITNNSSLSAGGVNNSESNSSFTMIGGTILANEGALGGVVNDGTLKIGGSAKIYGNNGSFGNNLGTIKLITIGDSTNGSDRNTILKPAPGFNVGITLLGFDGSEPSVTTGAFTTNGESTDLQYFTSDNIGFHVEYNKLGNYLELVKGHAHGLDTEDTADDIVFDKALSSSCINDGVLSKGNYYLTEDVVLDNGFIVENSDINICLCGHTLTTKKITKAGFNNNSSSIYVDSNSSLGIYDDSENNGIIKLEDSGLIINYGVLNINGGTIINTNQHDECIHSEKVLTIGENAVIDYVGDRTVITGIGEINLKGTIKAKISKRDAVCVEDSASYIRNGVETLIINVYNSAVVSSNNPALFSIHTDESIASKIVAKDTFTGTKNFTYYCTGMECPDGFEATVVYKDSNNNNTNDDFFKYFTFVSKTGMFVDLQKENGDIEVKKFIPTKQPTDNDKSFDTTISIANYEWYKATVSSGLISPSGFDGGLKTYNINTGIIGEAVFNTENNTFTVCAEIKGKITVPFTKLYMYIPEGKYTNLDFTIIALNEFRVKEKCKTDYITDQNCKDDPYNYGVYDAENGWWTAKKVGDYYYFSIRPDIQYTPGELELELLEDAVIYEITPDVLQNGVLILDDGIIASYTGPLAFKYENVVVGDKVNVGKTLDAPEVGYYICKATVHDTSIYSNPYYCTEVTKAPTSPVYYDKPAPVFTVPVSGDKDTVKVQATVRGSNATVNNVTEKEIETVGTGSNVIIDLTSIDDNVTGVTIPKSTFENVANSDAKGLEIRMPNGTVAVFDKTALAAIAEQAKGSNIKLVIDRDTKAEKSMTTAQKETVSEMNNPAVLDAYFVSNGQRITDFKGGEADVIAEYKTEYPVRVWYVSDDGSKELVPSTYDGKVASFTVTHFSHYVVEQLDGSSFKTCLRDETCVYAPFTDTDTKEWYHDGVHFCVENKYMNGYDNNLFGPNDTLSRAMVVRILFNLEGQPKVSESTNFTDVAKNEWYSDAIAWAQENKVVEGYENGLFGPEDPVTREQLAAIYNRYSKYKGFDVSQSAELTAFTDANLVSEWALKNIKWAVAVKLMNGKENSILDPTGYATRAEAATMLKNYCENIAK